jgi:hypothetical protein
MGDDDAKRLILARRARFVAAALAGVAGVAVACGGSIDDADPQPCLSPPYQPRDAGSGTDAEPQPCLEPLPPDAGDDAEPQVCLSPLPPDAGDAGDADTGVPQPCLSQLPPDAGDGG